MNMNLPNLCSGRHEPISEGGHGVQQSSDESASKKNFRVHRVVEIYVDAQNPPEVRADI